MSEDPLAIAKEAKALHQGLKDLLKNRDPWNKDVEIQRKTLQRQYLLLLLSHPNAKESKDAETHMWMQTSYALISIYKSRIAVLENALREAGTQRQQPRSQRPGPVEYRKLMQRFKQFLSTEEKFWTHLVVRIQRQFSLSEARSALATLSIITDTELGVDDLDAGKRDHFRFPPEPSENASSQPLTTAQRNNRRATLSKALVVLGDLARYREQYNEGSSRPRGPERGGRNARGRGSHADLPRAKTYDKARACYESARDLMPDEGNASHQLAILASYQKDTFESLVQYYKALCVRSAYDPAAENMGNVLSKFLEAWKRRRKGKQGRLPSEDLSGAKSNPPSFKDNVILLHALWRLSVEEMDSIAPKHDEGVVKEFSELVSDRVLPIDTITKVVIAAQGALWKHRKVGTSASVSMESRIASHILALHRALLQSGINQLDEAAKIVEEDLAMRITATFRRTLPALRIASKWLRVNLEYVLGGTPRDRDPGRFVVISSIPAFWEAYTSFSTRVVLVFPPTSLPNLKGPLEEDVDSRGYLPLSGMLMHDPPPVGLDGEDPRTPEQVHPNEEQLMRIRDIGHDARLIAEISGTPMETFRAQFSLIDSVQDSEVASAQDNTTAEGKGAILSTESNLATDNRHSEEEDARTETTDPVGDVFREVLGAPSSEDEEDEIVWNPRSMSPPAVSPVLSSKATPKNRAGGMSPLSPLSPTRSSIGMSSTSPPRAPDVITSPLQSPNSNVAGLSSGTPKTTAQDLLNNVMGVGRLTHKADAKSAFPPHLTHQQSFPSPIRHHQRLSSSSQPQTLFSGAPGPSIWSAAPDESVLSLSPRHQANGTLPASPLIGVAPIGHANLQTAVPSISSPPHASGHSGIPSSLFTSATSSAQGLWSHYDRTEEMLPTHTTHMAQIFPAPVERAHGRHHSSSIGQADVLVDPGYQGLDSLVYASSPRQAPLPSHAPDLYSAPQTLSSAFNNSMVLSSAIEPPLYQSMASFNSNDYPMSHGAHVSFGLPKHRDVRQQRAGGVWGDAG